MSAPRSRLGLYSPVARIAEGNLFIVLTSYYDRSGQEADEFMTLSGVAANDAVWAEVEGVWDEILTSRNPPAEYLHMVEAKNLRGKFAKRFGWDDTKVDRLISDLLVYLSTVDKGKYCQYSATVDMRAYRKLLAEGYKMSPPAHLCIEGCVDRIRAWYLFKYQGLDLEASLYFDRSEPFEPIFKARWEEEIERDRQSGGYSIWSHIVRVGSASKEKTPGIQISDLTAWGVNRQICGHPNFAYIATAMSAFVNTEWIIWDEPKLRERFKELP